MNAAHILERVDSGLSTRYLLLEGEIAINGEERTAERHKTSKRRDGNVQTIGVGIQGAGWVSGEHIKAFQQNPHTRVVAICSRTRESAEARANEAGLTQVNIYTNYEDLLRDKDVDAVSLCTPPNLHPQETIAAAKAGKHILIEKAVANDIQSLRDMQAAVREAGVKTVVSFVLRWNPQFMWIKRMLAEGAIGEIFYAEVDYWHNIGPWYRQYVWNVKKDVARSSFLSAGCHAVDAIRYFVEDEIVEVCAYSNKRNPDYEYDTNVVGVVKFANGAIGKLSSCFDVQCPYAFNIDLLGDKGTIRDNRIYAKEFFAGQMDWIEIPTIRPDSGDVRHHPFVGE
ncbi:MAG TPA: Gfo/Idh/MocA family oxidoreductase, partial [Chthonomonadales bacterium]|nr:Gfo/Idh/MocA family oxidoreductase [Chthonomonadales bacterium]